MQRNVIRGTLSISQHEPQAAFPVYKDVTEFEDCCTRSVPEDSNWQHQMSEIVNNKPEHRFELAADGHIAATYYEVADGVITFDHTEVPPELGGKGIGSKLVKGALDQVRADDLQVIANCEFVKGYIAKHPEYADLLKS
jgi:predicted GNAT family acetyltransferase